MLLIKAATITAGKGSFTPSRLIKIIERLIVENCSIMYKGIFEVYYNEIFTIGLVPSYYTIGSIKFM